MTLTNDEYENTAAAAVNLMLSKGPALGPWLATLTHGQRAMAVATLYDALGFSEDVYAALLFRPASVIMFELSEAAFIADTAEVYVNDETIINPNFYPGNL